MNRYVQAVTAVMVLVTAFPVWSAHDESRYSDSTYDGGRYDYAKVIDVQPVTEIVQVPEKHQVCRQVQVQRRVAEYRSPAPVIFGAVVGGIVGNQISRGHGHHNRHRYGHGKHHGYRHRSKHGHNRTAATVAGAAIGGVIASEVLYRKYPPKYYSTPTQVCDIQTTWNNEERVIAWDVSWKYRGQVYHSRMDKPPGDRIRVRVDVDPVYP